MMCFFSQKAVTLKAPESQTNYKQLQNTKKHRQQGEPK